MCQASKKGSCFVHFHNTPAQPSPLFLITTSGEHTVSLHKHAKTNYHQSMHLPHGRWQWQSLSQTPTHIFTINSCIYHQDGGSGNRFHKRRPTSVSINSKTKGSWLRTLDLIREYKETAPSSPLTAPAAFVLPSSSSSSSSVGRQTNLSHVFLQCSRRIEQTKKDAKLENTKVHVLTLLRESTTSFCCHHQI